MRLNERDDEHFVLDIEDMLPASVFQDGSFRLATLLPMIENEQMPSTADASQPSVPPAPGNVSISHPLLVRPGDVGNNIGMNPSSASTTASILTTRPHRSGRQRLYRPSVTNNSSGGHHNWHVPITNRHPNPPVILQRLLGPSTAQDFLQLTSGSSSLPRVIFSSNDFQIIAADEDWLDLHDSGLVSNSRSSSPLGSIPTAMLRWTEESRVLDGESMHDCVAALKPGIIEVWEKYRDEEIAERKEKRKKMIEEEERQKKESKDKEKKSDNDKETSDNKSSKESSVNANTERLAASIVEQVLGPVIATSNNRESTVATSENETSSSRIASASMEVIEGLGVTSSIPSNDVTIQNDNEITEMICSVSTAEQERSVAMDVNSDENEQISDISPEGGSQAPLPPPERASSSEVASGVGVITPEDLSSVTNASTDEVVNGSAEASTTKNELREERSEESMTNNATSENTAEAGNSETGASQNHTFDASNNASANSTNNNGSEIQNLLGDTEVPEGVDPSFLAALPESIRQEVIAEQLRLQRLNQQRASANSGPSSSSLNQPQAGSSTSTFNEVNPEFLAALPPNIQEEVLAQQRAEQQRLQAQTSNPDAPVDPGNFIQTLPPSLRRQVLADIDDSLLALLPVDLASEAHNLRQELEARNRQIQERLFTTHATTALSRILRTACKCLMQFDANLNYTICI